MSKIQINSVAGGNNIFGDNNTINNTFSVAQTMDKVLTREEYFQIILEVRELERISLGDYLEDKFMKLISKNPDFIKILYKDTYRVLDGVDKAGDNDLLIENGDFVIEYGDIKQTGHPTNLHFALTWLHFKLVEDFIKDDVFSLTAKMNSFEHDFLFVNYDTPAYTKKLRDLNSQLKLERNNKDKSGWTWSDLNDFLELKPNIAGLGVNLNAIFSKLMNRNK